MKKLLVIPGSCDALGGTLVSLSLLIRGFELAGAADRIRVAVRAGSLAEGYLRAAGQQSRIVPLAAAESISFLRVALAWARRAPADWPLLLDNCVEKQLMGPLIAAAPALRLAGRPLFHFCHDLALSHNRLGFALRRIAFAALRPAALCNSRFTATVVRPLFPDIRGVLYQPVEPPAREEAIPPALAPLLQPGRRLLFTPSRINKPGIVNDKNLRALVSVLVCLRAMGLDYACAVVGQDTSADGSNTAELLQTAAAAGVGEFFHVLPPTYGIGAYYRCAEAVVTLAPREPFGRTVVEAIAAGVPVIGSATGGIGEILSQFAPGWAVDPTDPEAAAAALARLPHDPDTPRLVARGRAWAAEHCSVAGYARCLMALTGLATDLPVGELA